MLNLNDRYRSLQVSLTQLDSDMDPSEIHGTLCGLLCASAEFDLQQWTSALFSEFDPNNDVVAAIKQELAELYQDSLNRLNDPLCQFELLLPDDDIDVEIQVYALGDWCQGFMIGLAMGGVDDFNVLPDDSREVINDMVEIARAGTSYDLGEEDDDDDDDAYLQLVEYIRVGVMLINEELNPMKMSVANHSTLH
ncbi:MAG: UPF0149 family protein [Thiohalomonadales bacterium]